jgi:hypothetical protein
MFLPLTGTPIWKMVRIRIRFADWLPVPLEVATVMTTSLTTDWTPGAGLAPPSCVIAMHTPWAHI